MLNEKFWICVGSKGLVLSFKLAKIEKLLVNKVGSYVTVYLYQVVRLAARNNCDSLYWSSVPRFQQQQAESLPRPSNRQVHLGTRPTIRSCGYLRPFPSSFYLRQCSWNSPLSTIWNAVVWPQWLASYPLVSFLLPLFCKFIIDLNSSHSKMYVYQHKIDSPHEHLPLPNQPLASHDCIDRNLTIGANNYVYICTTCFHRHSGTHS